MNMVSMVLAALRPQVAKLTAPERQAIIEQINALTEALLEGDQAGALLLLESMGAPPGLIDVVLDSFLFEAVHGD